MFLLVLMQEHFAATGPRKTAAQIQAQQRDLMSKLPEVCQMTPLPRTPSRNPLQEHDTPSQSAANACTSHLPAAHLQGTSIDSRVLDVATSLNMVRWKKAAHCASIKAPAVWHSQVVARTVQLALLASFGGKG